jgi:hypothetical protein
MKRAAATRVKIDDDIYARQIAKYPDLWAKLKSSVRVIKLTVQPKSAEQTLTDLRVLGLENPELYLRVVTDASHSSKFDTIIALDKDSGDVYEKFHLRLNTYKQEPGQAQIGVRYIAERLIQDGILPRSLAERAAEKGA